ncbi:MAG: RNA polymerase sigma factor [Pseudomonadales bacterium]
MFTEAEEGQRVCQVAQGDRQAFAELAAYYLPKLEQYGTRLSGRPALGEDLAQETLLQLWLEAGRFDPARGRLSTWLYRIARNRFLDQQRQGWRWLGLESLEGRDGVSDPELEQLSDAREVQQALQRLPERQRSALLLSYYEGLSHKEVAQVLGLGLRAAESLIVRARRALGKTLEEEHARTP